MIGMALQPGSLFKLFSGKGPQCSATGERTGLIAF